MNLSITDITDFFETYLTPFAPYKDDILYKRLIYTLANKYFDDSYNNIPQSFKKAFENQTIPKDFYNSLLLSNGLDEKTLSKLSSKDKEILVYTMLDFVNYKGTIECITKIIVNLQDSDKSSKTFNIYELYVDYDPSISDWCYRPYPIITHNEESILKEPLDFDLIYNKVPRYFIDRPQLNELRETQSAVFPIKTNILFIDYSKIYRESVLTTLFSYIVVSELKDYRIPIQFEQGIYMMSLLTFIKLWFFVIHYYYQIPFGTNYSLTNINNLINLELDSISPYQILRSSDSTDNRIDIPDLLLEYENLEKNKDPVEITTWYRNRIESKFIEYKKSSNISLQIFEDFIRSEIGDELIDYIKSRSDVESIIEKEIILNQIMTEMLNSLITYQHAQLSTDQRWKYLDYLIHVLPLLNIKVEDTSEYALIKFTKPYHVELVGDSGTYLRIYDLFNSVFLKQFQLFSIKFNRIAVLPISDNHFHKIETNKIVDTIYYLDYFHSLITLFPENTLEILDTTSIHPLFYKISSSIILDNQKIIPVNNTYNQLFIFDIEEIISKIKLNTTTSSDSSMSANSNFSNLSIVNISTYFEVDHISATS